MTRVTWLYLMKSHILLVIVFFAKTKSQVNVPIQILRSDNAKEYLSESLQTYMTQHDILHRPFM